MKKWSIINAKVSEWLLNYATTNNIKCLVIPVSGGIDSALVSYLCALTGMKVYAVSMPIHQHKDHLERANNHIAWLTEKFPNVESITIDLTSSFDILNNNLSTMIGRDNELCSANTRARLRMTTAYHLATDKGGLVVGTGNKVEDFVIGFFTKYGDGGVDISPIGDFLKSQVRNMAIAAKILQEIIDAKPSDGIYANERTDEQQIGASYDELEWTMNFPLSVINTMLDKKERGVSVKMLPNAADLPLTLERQLEVLKVFKTYNTKNKHKMVPIPIFDAQEILAKEFGMWAPLKYMV